MQMTGEQHVAAPRARVWEALNDPVVLAACIPGCQSLERDGDDRFAAVAEVKIGPIGARFKGAVTLSEIDAPNSYVLSGQGSGGIAGNAKGRAHVRLADDGAGTRVSWTVDAEVGGRMAQLGGPIIDATARQLAGQFFRKFGEVVTDGLPTAAGAAGAAAPASAPALALAPSGGLPWGWLAVLTVAVVAGFLLGRSGADYGWAVGMIGLAIGTFAMGRQTARGGAS